MSKVTVQLDSTVQFLSEQISILGKFGGAMPFLLLKPDDEKKLIVHAQDPRGFVVMSGKSLEPLTVPNPARLDNLSYLKSILELVHKASGRGKPAPLEFDIGLSADKKTEVVKTIRFRSGSKTAFSFKSSDPFLSKTAVRVSKIAEWPVEFHLNQNGVEQFEDAARTHLAGALKADDFDLFKLSVDNGQINALFESRAGKIDHTIGEVKSNYVIESTYPISTFRSVLSALGPDGGILRISDSALTMETETASGIYNFMVTRKIVR